MEQEYTGWGRWLQSKFVLGTARRIYLVIAAFSLLVAILAAAAVVIFQLWALKPAPEVPVPEARTPQPVSMDVSTVSRSLLPPTNVRFVPKPITGPLDQTDVVGYFDADTPNGLAAFPNDFDIFGGPDAAQFERVSVTVRYPTRIVVRAGLKPSAALLATINQAVSGGTSVQPRYTVNVVARDRFGNTTRPTAVSFSLAFGGAPTASQGAGTVQMSDLQVLARAIALHLDPAKTPTYFDQYRQALRVPGQCGTQDDNADFLRGFKASFNALESQLTLSTIEPFYAGVCAAWEEGASKELAARQASETARSEAMAKNMTLQAAHEVEELGLSVSKHIALYIVGSAIMAFLFISLFLAFLAIENHSDALRRAVEAIADRKRD
ncbi:MAG: hypothetical protein KGJ78_18275 [Alphaproteobacteria bacterium]|nr:hypothetical protein [Alphaproteobacteria bacterium]